TICHRALFLSPLFHITIRRPPHPTLLPYTTLFRSRPTGRSVGHCHSPRRPPTPCPAPRTPGTAPVPADIPDESVRRPCRLDRTRSEEHTSELQSRENLVCRLLLEKNKKQDGITINT